MDSTSPASQEQAQKAKQATGTMTRNILVADGSASMRKVIAFTLRSAGYCVTEAADGLQALQETQTNRYGLIVAARHLDKLDGLKLLLALRRQDNTHHTPFIMLATDASPAYKEQAREAGASAWLPRPFDPGKLVYAIRELMPD